MQEQMRAIIERHCTSLKAMLAEVETCLRPMGRGQPQEADFERALDLIHQIKGSSGSIGFGEVSASAAELESRLKQVRAAGEADANLSRDAVASLVRLRDLVAELAPHHSRLFNADFGKLAARS